MRHLIAAMIAAMMIGCGGDGRHAPQAPPRVLDAGLDAGEPDSGIVDFCVVDCWVGRTLVSTCWLDVCPAECQAGCECGDASAIGGHALLPAC